MAANNTREALNKLEEQLSCAVCLDKYTNPKILQCFHVFCEICLSHRRMVVRNEQGERLIICPTCRRTTPIPTTGVSGIPSAFHINNLLEIQRSLKGNEHPEHVANGGALNSTTSKKKVSAYCPDHTSRELELYCQTCEKLICYKCVVRGGEHQSHNYEEKAEAFEKYKERVTPALTLVEKQMTIINEALAQLEIRQGEIFNQQEITEAVILNTIEKLQKILEVRKTELVSQLHKIAEGKRESLFTQGDHLKTIQTQLSSCFEFLKESVKGGNEGEVLRIKTVIEKQVEELTAPFQLDTLKPNTEASMIASFSPGMTGMCQNYGKVLASVLDPYKCHSLIEDGDTHQHCIQVDNECVSTENPRPPAAGRLRDKKLIRIIDGVSNPRGVTLGKKGEVIVSENSGQCVSIFSSAGKKQLSFGTPGPDKGQFCHPRGIAVDGEGNILVTDIGNRRIQKFTATGQFAMDLNFEFPHDIVFNAVNNKIYVTNSNSHHIQILNPDLTYSSTFGKKGSGNGEFDIPWGLACDNTGNVYVADTNNHRIQVFTAEGTFLRKFGQCGENGGILKYPVGIAIDTNGGLVYVSEKGNHCISLFNSKGQFISSFGSKGHGPGEFMNLQGLALTEDGLLYVCDRDNNRVQCFQL